MDHLIGILGLGLLFGAFTFLHLKNGDATPTSCGGNGSCGNCKKGTCENSD
ncbi:MAG: hypothetical protein HQ519_01560 [Planctomycetes bacterium]|nr:hypothetical protein [Planctomycetota bacterium]